APWRDPRFNSRSGQADRRAGGEDRWRRHEGGTGGHLSALQAQTAHASGNCPRARPRPPRRVDPGRPLARTGGGGAKFSDYFDHVERWAQVPSHRALAMLRGRNEDVLSFEIEVDAADASPIKPVER